MFFNKQMSSSLWRLVYPLVDRLRIDSLLRNSIYIMSSTVVTSAIGYFYWLVAAHIYSPHDIGLASAFISAMTITSAFACLGLGSALVQTLPRSTGRYVWSLTLNTSMIMGILTSLSLSIIVVIALPYLSSQFALVKYQISYTVIFVGGALLWTVATLLDQAFVAERATGNMAMRNMAFALCKFLLLILLVQKGTFGIFSSWVLAIAITLILAGLVLVPRLRRYCLAIRGMVGQARTMLSSVAGHHFINIGSTLPMYLLPVLVSIRLSATDNAYFYITWMLGSLFFMVSASVATALFSEGSHETAKVMHNVRASFMIISMLLSPILLAFLFGGRYILLFFGSSYSQHGLSLLIILTISAVPDAITNIYVSLLRVQGRLHYAMILNLSMAILTLALAWILLPILGVSGTGWAWLIAQSSGSSIVGLDVLMARRHTLRQYKISSSQSVLQRLTIRNLAGFCRYVLLRLRFRNLCVGLFFLDRCAEIDIYPNAHIQFGHGICFMRDFTGHFYGDITIGNDVFFNRGCYVAAHNSLTIGNYCLFGEGVSIHDANHVLGRGFEPIALRGFKSEPITIGHNVWVGAKATILPGVYIGDNAVIGANAVVTHDVAANTVVGGVPAHILREISEKG